MRGEKVVEYLCDIYPNADIYTHVYDESKISKKINSHKVKTTFIGKLPFSRIFYKHYLPLMPLALKLLNLKEYENKRVFLKVCAGNTVPMGGLSLCVDKLMPCVKSLFYGEPCSNIPLIKN